MKFSDTSSQDGIIQACEDLCGFDKNGIAGNSSLLKRFTRLINDRYGQVSNWIWKSSGDWEFDDGNQTTLPEATCDLVANQQDYELPSTAQKLEKVSVMNQDGNYIPLRPFDEAEIEDVDMSEFYETAGTPTYYDVKGRSVILYPKPGAGYVTLAEGLKVCVTRDIVSFNSTATSQEPGFADNFHRLLPLGASLDYSLGKRDFDKVKYLQALIVESKADISEFYARRHRNPINAKMKPNDETYI